MRNLLEKNCHERDVKNGKISLLHRDWLRNQVFCAIAGIRDNESNGDKWVPRYGVCKRDR